MNQLKLFIDLTRLKKPIGFMLLFWPCSWGLTLAYDFSTKLNNFKFLDKDEILKLLAVDQLKKENNYEIILLFSSNRYITLNAEVIDIELTDQLTNDKDTKL